MATSSQIQPGLALIFDMDGVIVHSTPVHNEAWQAYLRANGIEADRETIEIKMLGKHNDAIVRIFFGDETPQPDVTRHGARKEVIFRELMGPRLERQLVPGVAGFLELHRDAPKALASNAERENVEFVLKRSGLRRHFTVVIDGHEVERPKPDPEIYFTTARRLGTPPEDCIVFEDSFTGVAAARAAGMRVVGLLTTTSELADCDLTVRDFLAPELGDWLRGQSATLRDPYSSV